MNDFPSIEVTTIPLCPTATMGFPITTDNNEEVVDKPLVGNQLKIGSLICDCGWENETVGEFIVYPLPPVEIATLEIIPASDTTAVPSPDDVSLLSIINILSSDPWIGSTSLNKGYALFTYIDVSVVFKFLIILVVGLIVGIKFGLALETKEPRITLSSVCFVHFNGLILSEFVLIPILS